MRTGLVHAYFGEGKGKSTAALGLGLRCAGSGMTVFVIQFLKSSQSGELEAVKRLEPAFKIFRFDRMRREIWPSTAQQMEESRKDSANAMQFARKVMSAHQCDVLILDEVLTAIAQRIVELNEVLDLIEKKPTDIEIVVTGKTLPDAIYRRSNYVTEMRLWKHPRQDGIEAREGIEY
ncbi:cob(I)yrinic acid a,c-diamide adenosyltransferase [Bianquea renquensis]|nr:cob(I)yrinic acid a,c-diamide adenosyltransferase [Bianquea renquensis]